MINYFRFTIGTGMDVFNSLPILVFMADRLPSGKPKNDYFDVYYYCIFLSAFLLIQMTDIQFMTDIMQCNQVSRKYALCLVHTSWSQSKFKFIDKIIRNCLIKAHSNQVHYFAQKIIYTKIHFLQVIKVSHIKPNFKFFITYFPILYYSFYLFYQPMNIIHNSAQKFVPNPIFNQFIDHDHDYSHENENQPYQKNKQNISASMKKAMSLEQPTLFQDKTNLQTQSKSKDSLKKITVLSLVPENVKIQSNLTDACGQPISELSFAESENIKKTKPKKKVSPRKKNLQQLFDEILDNPDKDCIFVENNNQSNERKTNSSNQSYQANGKNENLQESKTVEKIAQESQRLESQSHQEQQAEVGQQKDALFKINKFHFLHNELNLDSSSDEQGQKPNQQIRGSSSSENDYDQQKIDFAMPKIKSRNNFFINKDDLNLDSSDESEEEQKEGKNIKETPQKADPIKEQPQQNDQKNSPQKSSRTLSISDFRREFVQSGEEYLKKPLPEGVTIDLIIKRDKSKKNSDSIEYQLYDAKTLRMIVVVVKKAGVHEIMAKKNIEDPKAHPDMKYLTAKLESNFLGSEFNLKYVIRSNQQSKKSLKSNLQQEIAATVCYETNILGFKGPRKMSIYIPENQNVKYYGDKSLEEHYSKKCHHRIEKYVNKQAKWNKEVQSYVLNMKGKARLSSVKNFVIAKDSKGQDGKGSEEEKPYVIFGKISKEIFNLCISGPFSIIQGLSLAVTTFERKLICE